VASACVLALGQGLRAVIDAGFGSGDPAHLNLALAGFPAGRSGARGRDMVPAST